MPTLAKNKWRVKTSGLSTLHTAAHWRDSNPPLTEPPEGTVQPAGINGLRRSADAGTGPAVGIRGRSTPPPPVACILAGPRPPSVRTPGGRIRDRGRCAVERGVRSRRHRRRRDGNVHRMDGRAARQPGGRVGAGPRGRSGDRVLSGGPGPTGATTSTPATHDSRTRRFGCGPSSRRRPAPTCWCAAVV